MKRALPYILIVVALLVAGGIYLDATHKEPIIKTGLQNKGSAPEFTEITNWLNSNPLTMQSLRGKVVLIDFWTYTCINCIRTLPYVTKWYDAYKDQGLVVVGVHTPEFAFEKDTDNVARAIKQFKINYPVAQDNDYGIWNAYQNHYWPAEYLIDQNGSIVKTHFGEGEYDTMEDAIRSLLGMDAAVAEDSGPELGKVDSPEMYFGTDRLENLVASQQKFTGKETLYRFPVGTQPLNTFALEGEWKFYPDKAVLAEGSEGSGKIRLRFKAGKVHMVAAGNTPLALKVTVDGKSQPDVTVHESQLYTLYDSMDYNEHVLEISIPEAGNLEAFTFTFG